MKKRKKYADFSQLAYHLVEQSTTEAVQIPTKAQVSALMAHLGRKGGKIGGKRRLETLSAEQRSSIAKKAATARWKKK